MRAATRERMISIMALVLIISIGFLVPKAPFLPDAQRGTSLPASGFPLTPGPYSLIPFFITIHATIAANFSS